MFGRGFLLSTFIVAVIFASTVYSESVSKSCEGSVCTCKLDGVEVPCESGPDVPIPAIPLTKEACESMGPEGRAAAKTGGAECPPGPYSNDQNPNVPDPAKNPSKPLTKEECEDMGPLGRATVNEAAKIAGQKCPDGPYLNDPPTDGAEKIEFALGLMIASLFTYIFLH